jgi:hypothetical protein
MKGYAQHSVVELCTHAAAMQSAVFWRFGRLVWRCTWQYSAHHMQRHKGSWQSLITQTTAPHTAQAMQWTVPASTPACLTQVVVNVVDAI